MATLEGAANRDSERYRSEVAPIKPYKAKRILDIIAAATGLLLVSAPAAIIALMIRLSSPGPVVFRQTRIGRDGKEFAFYKFRSMKMGCDDTRHREYMKLFIE